MAGFGRVHKKFFEKYPHFNCFVRADGTLENALAQEVFQVFRDGWMSHPNYSLGQVGILAKVTEVGIEVAEKPRMHVSSTRLYQERDRLQKQHGGRFVAFTCSGDVGAELAQLAISNYRKHKKTEGVKNEQSQSSSAGSEESPAGVQQTPTQDS